jgi:hypothetical protein
MTSKEARKLSKQGPINKIYRWIREACSREEYFVETSEVLRQKYIKILESNGFRVEKCVIKSIFSDEKSFIGYKISW